MKIYYHKMIERKEGKLPKGLEDVRSITRAFDRPYTISEALTHCVDMQDRDLRVFLLGNSKKPSYQEMTDAGKQVVELFRQSNIPTMRSVSYDDKWYLAVICHLHGGLHLPLKTLNSPLFMEYIIEISRTS